MPQLTEYQYAQLTNQAECYIHTHPERINYTFPHGAFSDLSDQTALADTATPMEFDTVDVNDGVDITGTPPTKINVPISGVYNIQFSAQLVNTDTPAVNVSVWLKRSGSNLANSNTYITVPGKHAGGDGYAVAAWNWLVNLAKDEYVELYWSTPSTAVSIQHIDAQVSPDRPATPSIILTVTLVSD